MYSRQDLGRMPRVPRNYSGNAFREDLAPPPQEETSLPLEEAVRETRSLSEPSPADVAARARPEPFRLFHSGGFGSEELLLLGLILLLSQNETKDDLLILLLLLLLIQ